MGMVVMSKRELNRLDVLARLDSDKLTAQAAAELMKITPRQTYRLLRRYRDGGASAVANQRRGRLKAPVTTTWGKTMKKLRRNEAGAAPAMRRSLTTPPSRREPVFRGGHDSPFGVYDSHLS